jgi:hypothetical protein
MTENPWREHEVEYLAHLREERRRFAWVMRRYGGLTPPESWAAALDAYPYEPRDEPYRGLTFHDEAWHWAMLTIHGTSYPAELPELAGPPDEYRALDRATPTTCRPRPPTPAPRRRVRAPSPETSR